MVYSYFYNTGKKQKMFIYTIKTFYDKSSKEKPKGVNLQNHEFNLKEEESNESEISSRTVVVDLPENFIKERNKKYLFDMFVRRDKTGGGYIEEYQYRPENKMAIITYKSQMNAQRVLSQQTIVSDGYKFVVKPCSQHDNLNRDEQKSEETVKASDNSQCEVFFKNKFYLVFENLKNKEDREKVSLYATILAKTKPTQTQMVDSSTGKWLIEFSHDKKIGKYLI